MTPSSRSRPDADPRIPSAAKPGRRSTPSDSRSTRNEPTVAGPRRPDPGAHDREPQGREPRRPGLLPGRVATSRRRRRRGRAGDGATGRRPAALLGRRVVDERAVLDDRADEPRSQVAGPARPRARRGRRRGRASRTRAPSSRRPHRARARTSAGLPHPRPEPARLDRRTIRCSPASTIAAGARGSKRRRGRASEPADGVERRAAAGRASGAAAGGAPGPGASAPTVVAGRGVLDERGAGAVRALPRCLALVTQFVTGRRYDGGRRSQSAQAAVVRPKSRELLSR